MAVRELLLIDWEPVVAHYGLTQNIMCTGFILSNGDMLDFGEHRFPFQKVPHNTIEEITGKEKFVLVLGTDIIKVEHGAGNVLGFYSYHPPNCAQLHQILDGVMLSFGDVRNIDIGLYATHIFASIKSRKVENVLEQIKSIYRS